MKQLDSKNLKKANEEAIFTLLTYLVHHTTPKNNETLKSLIEKLESHSKLSPQWKDKDTLKLKILKNSIAKNSHLANSRISDLTYSKSGLTACVFTKPNGDISVVFKGTGNGEWIDNGEGLSGIPEENTYITPDGIRIVEKDFATDQQVQALNWFNTIAAKNNWNSKNSITVSGHSKGGNKAQFITINSDFPDRCYSFNGHGFSPEALLSLKKLYGEKFETRRKKIVSISADNDYINVIGERLTTEKNIYFFKSAWRFHDLESILDNSGNLRQQTKQGKLSQYIEAVSKELMLLPPSLRQYATMGVMNIFQKYLGQEDAVNGDKVSIEKTIAGLGVTLGPVLNNIPNLANRN